MVLLAQAAETSLTFSFNWVVTLILIVVVFAAVMGACAYQILLERKIAAWAQDRIGPNRAGPLGLLQPIADGLKFFLKEEVIPKNVDKLFFLLAPGIAVSTALIAIAVVPVGPTTVLPEIRWPQTIAEEKALDPSVKIELEKYNDTFQFVIAPHVDIGVVFVFAIGSLAIYAVVLGGWSSNNKFSFLGALRSSAQLLSYEIPMGMSVLGVLLVTGSLNLEKIIDYQYHNGWNFLFQPTACLLFSIAVFAECNRLPFDLPESEQELVGGYHTEYGAMKFAMFFLGEYAHMVTVSFLVVALFFGGWLLPGVAEPGPSSVAMMIVKLVIFIVKATLYIIFFMIVRWTIPRFRFDQLMGLAWKGLLPLAFANLVAVMVINYFFPAGGYSHWPLLPLSVAILVAAGYLTLRGAPTHGRTPLDVRGPGTPRPLVTKS